MGKVSAGRGMHNRQEVARDRSGIDAGQRIAGRNDLEIAEVGGGEEFREIAPGA
jgi:hypothetical protein